MLRQRDRRRRSCRGTLKRVSVLAAVLGAVALAEARQAPPAATPPRFQEALTAEASGKYTVALDRLYRLEDVVDVAVDRAFGVYRLDRKNRRVVVEAIRLSGDGPYAFDFVTLGVVQIPEAGLKMPSALAVTDDGEVVVVGKDTRLLRFR